MFLAIPEANSHRLDSKRASRSVQRLLKARLRVGTVSLPQHSVDQKNYKTSPDSVSGEMGSILIRDSRSHIQQEDLGRG